MMKNFFSFILFLLVSLTSHADEWLIIEQDGQPIKAFSLENKPIITFDVDKFIITYPDDEPFTEFAADNLKFYFDVKVPKLPDNPDDSDDPEGPVEPGEEDMVSSTSSPVFTFTYRDGHTVLLSGVPEKDIIQVFSVNGMKMPINIERNDNHVILHLDNYLPSVYVICVGNQSYKVRKK